MPCMFWEQVMDNPNKEDWMQKKWRPMMAIMYMIVCVFDFVIFPIMFTGVQFWEVEAVNDAFRQWNPITLGGGGLFHVAMGAVLGVTAWSRGQEKIAGAATNPVQVQTVQTQPVQQIQHAPVSSPRRAQPIISEEETAEQVKVGFGGKLAPPDSPQPLL